MKKILVFDDDKITNDIFSRIFSNEDLKIYDSIDLQSIYEWKPDIIIYDRDVANRCIKEFYGVVNRNNTVLIECTIDESNTSLGVSIYEPDARHYKPLSENIFKKLFKSQYETFIKKGRINNKVIIIDDNDHQRSRLVSLLESDYSVQDFGSAINALEYLKKDNITKPDLIILDIIMDNMNGFEFMQKLREDFSKEIPILCLSSRKIGQFVNKAITLGASDYMYKPYNTLQLRNKVDNLIK